VKKAEKINPPNGKLQRSCSSSAQMRNSKQFGFEDLAA
jgi:hypothetical protein